MQIHPGSVACEFSGLRYGKSGSDPLRRAHLFIFGSLPLHPVLPLY
jgi:hypothetical protein